MSPEGPVGARSGQAQGGVAAEGVADQGDSLQVEVGEVGSGEGGDEAAELVLTVEAGGGCPEVGGGEADRLAGWGVAGAVLVVGGDDPVAFAGQGLQ